MSILHQFQKATNDFIETANLTSSEQFLLKPTLEEWCIAEIIEHVCISDQSAYYAIIKEKVVDQSELKGTFQERIEFLLANADIKLEAPDAAIPLGKFTNLEAALAEFSKTRIKLIQKLETADLELFATGFRHPRLGYMKRGEWLQFITWHSQHHSKQIIKVLKTLNIN